MDIRVGTIVAGSLLTLAACSASNSPTRSTPPEATLTGTVVDVAGDPLVYPVMRSGISYLPVVPVPPDLVAATITVLRGELTATLSFASGTRSASDTFGCVYLDVDENASTGNPSAGGDVPLGFDFSVCAVNPRGSMTAQVSRLNGPGTTATGIGAVPAMFPSVDQIRFAVPLAMLGNDDGRMAFKVTSYQWEDSPIFNTAELDWMPDLGRTAGLVR